tara:strand:+ start:5529 stop:5765 length:237 start_codon:yes stop_codon:yes gene_type:complete
MSKKEPNILFPYPDQEPTTFSFPIEDHLRRQMREYESVIKILIEDKGLTLDQVMFNYRENKPLHADNLYSNHKYESED